MWAALFDCLFSLAEGSLPSSRGIKTASFSVWTAGWSRPRKVNTKLIWALIFLMQTWRVQSLSFDWGPHKVRYDPPEAASGAEHLRSRINCDCLAHIINSQLMLIRALRWWLWISFILIDCKTAGGKVLQQRKHLEVASVLRDLITFIIWGGIWLCKCL